MKKIYTFGLTLLLSFSVFSQNAWQKTYNTTSTNSHTIQTLDGGYASVGSVSSAPTAGLSDIVLTKYDANGNVQWAQIYGGTNNEYGHLVAQASDGSYYIGGTSNSFLSSDGALLIYTDVSGNLVWSKLLNTYGSYPSSLTTSATDAIFTGIKVSSSSFPSYYGFIYRASNTGTTILNNALNANNGYLSNAIGQTTSDGGYVMAGTQKSSSSPEIIVGKYTSAFVASWIKVISGSGSDFVKSIQQTSDGGYIVCGITTSYGQGGLDAYLMKLDNSGDIVWYKTYGDTQTNSGWFAKQTSDGGYIMVGSSTHSSNMNINLVKTDSIGKLIWAKEFDNGGNEESRTVSQTSDGGYIISGISGTGNSYLLKTDINGNAGGCATINYYPVVFNYSPAIANDPAYYANSTIATPAPVQNPRTVTATSTCSAPLCTANAAFSANQNIVVQGSTVVFTNSSTNASAYNWLVGSTSFSTATNASYQFNTAGTYTITLIAGNGTCNDSAFTTITVTPTITNSSWQKKYNTKLDVTYGTTIQTIDGGYANAGIAIPGTFVTAGQNDIVFTKYDANGNVQWTKSYGGTNIEGGNLIAQASDGSYYIGGTSNSFLSSDGALLIHTDVNGNLVWSKLLNTYGSYPSSLTTSGTDAIFTGIKISSSSFPSYYGFIYRVSNTGTTILNNALNANNGYLSNAVGQVTADGGYIMAGTQKSSSSPEIIIAKYTSTFVASWIKVISGAGSDYLSTIKQTSDGGYIVCGTTTTFGQGQHEAYLTKLDANGNMLWYKTYGDTDRNYGVDVVQNSNGTYTLVGYTSVAGTNENVFLINTSSNGTILWGKMYDDALGNNEATKINKTTDKGYIISATSGNSSSSLWLIKTDSLGISGGCNTSSYTPTYFNYSPTIANDPAYYANSTITSTPAVENLVMAIVTPICSQLNCPIVSSFTSSATSGCIGANISFTNTSNGGATTYNWLVNGVSYATTSNFSYVFNAAGTYIVKFAAGNGGCVDTSITTITINPSAPTPGPISGTALICQGSANTYSIAAVSGATSYTWTLPNGWSGSSSTNSINTVASANSGVITVTADNGCGSSSPSIYTIAVNPLPTVSYTQSPAMICWQMSQINLSAASPTGGIYSGTTVTGNTFFPTIAGQGTFIITYTYTDINSCVNSDTSLITVINCTGVEQNTIEEISIYPNPAKELITINGITSSTQVKLFNVIGEVILSQQLSNDKSVIDLSNLRDGIYFIQLNTEKGMITKKIIKE